MREQYIRTWNRGTTERNVYDSRKAQDDAADAPDYAAPEDGPTTNASPQRPHRRANLEKQADDLKIPHRSVDRRNAHSAVRSPQLRSIRSHLQRLPSGPFCH